MSENEYILVELIGLAFSVYDTEYSFISIQSSIENLYYTFCTYYEMKFWFVQSFKQYMNES